MRFGVLAAAAAGLLCSSQADAARYFEFELKGSALFLPNPGLGDGQHSYQYDLTYQFVFDTLNPASTYVASSSSDNVFLNVNGSQGLVYDIANGDTGPQFSFGFNFASVASSAALQALAISSPSFNYVYRVDPRYNYTITSLPGAITSLTARTTDVAPSFTGILGGATATAVPEPASWAMMIGGVAIVGAAARRRRRKGMAAA